MYVDKGGTFERGEIRRQRWFKYAFRGFPFGDIKGLWSIELSELLEGLWDETLKNFFHP